jgi:hypothetical protein
MASLSNLYHHSSTVRLAFTAHMASAMEDSRIIVADNIDHFIVVDLIVDSNQTH